MVEPLRAGPARGLTPRHGLLAVTLPGCGMTRLMARAAARPLAYLDLGSTSGTPAGGAPQPIGTLFAHRVF